MDINNLFGSRDIRIGILNLLRFIPDKPMLQLEYRLKIGKKLHLNPPATFNEKLQWLKLYDRKPVYTKMVDKYAVREIIKDKIGEQYLVPIYGYWENAEDIDFDKLPDKFVLKCNHDSGSVFVCKDKEKINIEEVRRKLNKHLKVDQFILGREWPYKNIERLIIAEEYLQDRDNKCLPVYKFFCFNGNPKIIQQIQNDKQPNETVDYFDLNWNRINMAQRFPNSKQVIEKPKKLGEMVDIARRLSKDTCFLRVDLYVVNNQVYFSELTFYTDAGYSVFEPESEHWDEKLGSWIELRGKG